MTRQSRDESGKNRIVVEGMTSVEIDEIRRVLRKYGQAHLLTFWDELAAAERDALRADLARVDFEQVARLVPTHVLSAPEAGVEHAIEPPEVMRIAPGSPEHREAAAAGAEMVAAGQVAALVVAGGQGTRLGYDGPKGMFPISPVKNKSLFQLFAESILSAQRSCGGMVPWYIMTSDLNDAPTREYFAANKYFGLRPENVIFFRQGMMPALGTDGRILLDQKHRVAVSPDGHGGALRALATTGALRDMARRGVQAISYFQVDNPLVRPVDPVFLGLHRKCESQLSSITVTKVDDLEKVGNFARVGGRTCVIEYSDLPEALARSRNADGSRRLNYGSIAIHVFARSFVERLTENIHAMKLPWHRALKKVPYIRLESGERIDPAEPNAVKLEMFVFDALPLADRTLILESRRAEVFSPVKNATGVDSAESARRDLTARAAAWLASCGVNVPRRPDGQVDATLEISPLFAQDREELAERLTHRPTVQPGDTLYLE